MVAQRRSSLFDNVDPRLAGLIEGFQYGPYKVNPTSGYRPGDPRRHGQGNAMDVQLIDPKTGAALANYQDPNTFGAYQEYANALYQHALQTNPELARQIRWGGYFGGPKGKYGAMDLMHFDIGGGPMAGGSWEGGLNPEQASLWGLKPGGGVGGAGGQNQGPPANTQVTQYTPEQRRNAIASLESAGSGDYGALGVLIGDPEEGRDRAYGRYQIMGKNIPAWTKEVLGRSMSPDEFLADPKAQDAVFDAKFGSYVQKYGESGAAEAWLGGPGAVGQAPRKDPLGTTTVSYSDKYLKALGAPTGATSAPGAATTQPGGSLAPPMAPAADPGARNSNDLMASLGGIAGISDKAPALPPSTVPKIPATLTAAQPAPVAETSVQEQLRAQLAQKMAALNSGKLWG